MQLAKARDAGTIISSFRFIIILNYYYYRFQTAIPRTQQSEGEETELRGTLKSQDFSGRRESFVSPSRNSKAQF